MVIEDHANRGSTVDADKDAAEFTAGCRELGCTPHVATTARRSMRGPSRLSSSRISMMK
jgi:hypothetical protein